MNALHWTRGEPPKDGNLFAATGRSKVDATGIEYPFAMFLRWDSEASAWVTPTGWRLDITKGQMKITWHWHTLAPQRELEAP